MHMRTISCWYAINWIFSENNFEYTRISNKNTAFDINLKNVRSWENSIRMVAYHRQEYYCLYLKIYNQNIE